MAGKTVTSWAGVSLVASVLGWLGIAALPVSLEYGMRGDTTGVSAGLYVLFFGFLSVSLWLLGVISGVVALDKVRGGECGGRGLAWAGLVLGCLPFAVSFAWAVYVWLR